MSTAIGLAVGRRIREIRQARGMSQEDLALFVGSHRAIVSRVERGGRETAGTSLSAMGTGRHR